MGVTELIVVITDSQIRDVVTMVSDGVNGSSMMCLKA